MAEPEIRPYVPPNLKKLSSAVSLLKKLERWLKPKRKRFWRLAGTNRGFTESATDAETLRQFNYGLEAKGWVNFGETLARWLKRSPKWDASLRLWERNWIETRTPPPFPHQGRHIKYKSLLFDEGVSLAIREYLDTAVWHASLKGVCDAILQCENSAVDTMRIDAVLRNTQKGRKGISGQLMATKVCAIGSGSYQAGGRQLLTAY